MTLERPAGRDDLRSKPIQTKLADRRLSGWKEIGAFFGKNERTVKRWESRGLPVHRLPGTTKAAVFAYTRELEAWLTSGNAEIAEAASTQEDAVDIAHAVVSPLATARTDRLHPMLAAILLVFLLAAGAGVFLLVRSGSTTQVTATHIPAPEVRELYLSGLYHWNTRTAQGLKQAKGEFEQVLAKDPDYAQAHAGLANAYNLLAQYGVMPAAEAYPKAKAEAERAIALDDHLACAYGALAFATFYGSKDLRRAETLMKRALELDPNSALTYHWYALMMMHTGKFEEPLRAITRAQELDPNSHAILANRGLILFYAGHADEAEALLKDLSRSAPDFLSPHYYLATLYLNQHRYDDYLRESLTAARIEGNTALESEIAAGAEGYRAGGAKGLFAAMLAVQESELAAGRETSFNVARTAALLGDSETALKSLRRSLADGEPDLLGMRIDPSFTALRSDPQFRQLAANVLDVPE
jgi:tetratricopeptide (TPR) repeat protein/phage terminase Nu1 subunit (DNA packaging protein)